MCYKVYIVLVILECAFKSVAIYFVAMQNLQNVFLDKYFIQFLTTKRIQKYSFCLYLSIFKCTPFLIIGISWELMVVNGKIWDWCVVCMVWCGTARRLWVG